MGWLDRLFARPPKTEPSSLEVLVNSYGKVLGEGTSVERDVSELPFDKCSIRKGLLEAIQMTPAGSMREQLKAGYLALADFQDLEALKAKGQSVPLAIAAEAEALLRELKEMGL